MSDSMYRLYDSDGYSPFGERARKKAEAARQKAEEARQKKIEEDFQNNTFMLAQTFDESPNHDEVEQIQAKAAATFDENGLEVVDLQNKENVTKNTVARNLFEKFGIDPQGQPMRNSKVARKDSPLHSSPSTSPSPDPPSSLDTQPTETPTQCSSPASLFSEEDDDLADVVDRDDLCPYCLQNPCDHSEDIFDTRQRLSLYYDENIAVRKATAVSLASSVIPYHLRDFCFMRRMEPSKLPHQQKKKNWKVQPGLPPTPSAFHRKIPSNDNPIP